MNELVRVPDQSSEPADDPDLIATIKACAKESRNARTGWLKEAQECYDFVAGHQWTPDELQALKDARRPPVVFNRIEPVINVVAGLEVTNRQEVKYLPRTLDDSGPNEVLTGAAQWTRDECNAEDEESESFLDMAICGEGWTETRLDYEYDQDGSIDTARTDPMEVLPDPNAKKKNYKDAEYLIREKMVLVTWLEETWPEKADEIDVSASTTEDSEFSGEAHLNVVGDQYRSPGAGSSSGSAHFRKELKLTEYQYKKRVPYYRIQDPQTGEVAEFSVEQHDQIQERAQSIMGTRLKSIRQTKCIHYRAFSVGDTLLENAECPDPGSFTYKAMTAKRDKKKKCWYGLVRGMLDPQRWANKFFSQSMFILNTNAKGGVMYEEGSVGDAKEFEQSWAHPDKPTKVAAGAITGGRIQPKQPPAFPPELAKLLDFSIQSIYQVSGVSPEMLGAVDREQAAVLEYQRKQAGVTILATLFDALRKYRKEQGKTLLYLIQNYLSDGRLVRITGKEGQKYVPLTKQDGVARYDVIIDESPSSPNQKEKTWMIVERLLPLFLKLGIPLPPETYDYMPLPQSLIDALKKPNPQRDAEQQKQKQIQERGQLAEIEVDETTALENKASAQLKMAQANNQQGEGGEGQARAMAEMASAGTERMTAQHGMRMSEAKTSAGIDAQRQENARKLMETLGNLELKRKSDAERNQIMADRPQGK